MSGVVGLLWIDNWHLCEEAVETVLRGGVLRRLPDLGDTAPPRIETSSSSEAKPPRKAAPASSKEEEAASCGLDLCLLPQSSAVISRAGPGIGLPGQLSRLIREGERHRLATSLTNYEVSVTRRGVECSLPRRAGAF